MRIGKFILRTVLFLLLAAAVGAGLYLYPAWKAAVRRAAQRSPIT